MRIKELFLFLLFCLSAASGYSQSVTTMSYAQLKKVYQQQNDTVYVVNFFASWCDPCLKELPDFVKFADQHKNIRLLFVSLDFKKDYRETLPALITKYHITAPVYFLDESKAGNWIGDVDAGWSGAIPATLFYRKNKHLFIQDTFTQQSLTDTLTTFIK